MLDKQEQRAPRQAGLTASSRLRGDAKQRPKLVLAQSDYAPTPYEATDWEVVGERMEDDGFQAMTLAVMRDTRCTPDPMFGTFDADTEFSDGGEWTSPGGDPKKIKAKREEEPQIDQAMLDAAAAQSFEAGHQAGYKEGFAAAEQTIVERYEELSKRVTSFTAAVEGGVGEKYAILEKQAFELSLAVAKKLLETTVEAKPEYIIQVIRNGLHSLGAAKPFRIRVSMQDYEFLELIGLPADLTTTELGVKYVADDAIKSGCIIETDYGEVNLELDRMWEQVQESLFAVCS